MHLTCLETWRKHRRSTGSNSCSTLHLFNRLTKWVKCFRAWPRRSTTKGSHEPYPKSSTSTSTSPAPTTRRANRPTGTTAPTIWRWASITRPNSANISASPAIFLSWAAGRTLSAGFSGTMAISGLRLDPSRRSRESSSTSTSSSTSKMSLKNGSTVRIDWRIWPSSNPNKSTKASPIRGAWNWLTFGTRSRSSFRYSTPPPTTPTKSYSTASNPTKISEWPARPCPSPGCPTNTAKTSKSSRATSSWAMTISRGTSRKTRWGLLSISTSWTDTAKRSPSTNVPTTWGYSKSENRKNILKMTAQEVISCILSTGRRKFVRATFWGHSLPNNWIKPASFADPFRKRRSIWINWWRRGLLPSFASKPWMISKI